MSSRRTTTTDRRGSEAGLRELELGGRELLASVERVLDVLDGWEAPTPSGASERRLDARMDSLEPRTPPGAGLALAGVLVLAMAMAVAVQSFHLSVGVHLWEGLSESSPLGYADGALATWLAAIGIGTVLCVTSLPLLIRRTGTSAFLRLSAAQRRTEIA